MAQYCSRLRISSLRICHSGFNGQRDLWDHLLECLLGRVMVGTILGAMRAMNFSKAEVVTRSLTLNMVQEFGAAQFCIATRGHSIVMRSNCY